MSEKVVRVGAVAYDPKVVTIWEGFREYFREAGVPTDYVLFSNYEALIEAMFDRQIDIAWNTNVAYVRSQERTGGQCQALAMRNTDQDFTTRLIARSDSGIYGLTDLRGKRLALGSADSGQAAILPLFWLREAGIDPDNDLEILSFNSDVGKHGDTGTSELQVLQALHEGSVDAGMIGHVYLIYAIIFPKNRKQLKQIFNSNVGAILIALFFMSFGTILGGIWADQSWGRFWGWDPKENGALLICMWQILILHTRLAGMIRGLEFALAMIINNIVVVLAWFGVNLLSVGLHSYGFSEGIATNLLLFVSLEILFGVSCYTIAKLKSGILISNE